MHIRESLLAAGLVALGSAVSASTMDDYRGALQPRQYDPSAGGDEPIDCLLASLSRPAWFIWDPQFLVINYTADMNPQNQEIYGDFRFSAYSLPLNTSTQCMVQNIDLSPRNFSSDGPWYTCNDTVTEFQITLSTFTMAVRSKWVCDNAPTQVSQDPLFVRKPLPDS